MVEAISVTLPFSMHSSKVCCCFLLKYWISSRYSSTPFIPSKVPVLCTASLISAVEAVVPLSFTRCLSVFLAIMEATVVLPTPEGP